MKTVRYLCGWAVMAAAPSLMRFAFSLTDDPSMRLVMIPIVLGMSGCGLALMMSGSDRRFLDSDVVTLGLSESASSESSARPSAE